MKRSEMIEKITDRLASFNTAKLSHEDLATLMLTVVEKAGMLPPKQDKEWPKFAPETDINWRMWEAE